MENPKKCEFFTKQFQVSRFLLGFEKASLMGSSQSGRGQILYIIYCFLWAFAFTAVLIYDLYNNIVNKKEGAKWPTQISNWSFAVVTCSAILQSTTAVYQLIKNRRDEDLKQVPVIYKLSWIFYNIGINSAIFVTVLFWVAVYKPGDKIVVTTVLFHGGNASYALLNHFITGIPIRILHFWQGLLYFIVFNVFSVIYQLGGNNPPIYSSLDWKNAPGPTIGLILALGLVAIPAVHLIFFFMYWLRVLLYSLCLCSTESESKADSNNANDLCEENEVNIALTSGNGDM